MMTQKEYIELFFKFLRELDLMDSFVIGFKTDKDNKKCRDLSSALLCKLRNEADGNSIHEDDIVMSSFRWKGTNDGILVWTIVDGLWRQHLEDIDL